MYRVSGDATTPVCDDTPLRRPVLVGGRLEGHVSGEGSEWAVIGE